MSPRRVVEVTGMDSKGRSFVREEKPRLAGNQLALALSQTPLKASGVSQMKQHGTLLVCGSRTWFAKEDVSMQLALLVPDLVIHGDAAGADAVADALAFAAGIDVRRFPVDTAKDGEWPMAGPRRSARMIAEGKPTQGLALGDLKKVVSGVNRLTGTGQTVDMLLKQKLVVRWVRYPGAKHVDLTAMP